ncbi:MAG: 2-C-methyl-D-erythritol 2,4-cyclodiphosphate synthase [Elusimicrobia bacterium]|jgi:2-C-methyl-D-erythritol 2,4-cyclodiphosphate synthase|nr:2-C-methyl-D-erythritol 2,4-cyclodiphosphate synthase [Elusimicrobiota bacterium]
MTTLGLGYDSHRFVKGRPLVLGGVRVPFEKGLAGHSDADVVLHAVIDALLGAAGMGDIGTFYPDSDARWKGADSLRLLEDVHRRLRRRFSVSNVDVTLLAEAPRIGPYKNRMRAKMARTLRISVDCVNVKAKTNEGMGFVGRREGLAALAVCGLLPKSKQKK